MRCRSGERQWQEVVDVAKQADGDETASPRGCPDNSEWQPRPSPAIPRQTRQATPTIRGSHPQGRKLKQLVTDILKNRKKFHPSKTPVASPSRSAGDSWGTFPTCHRKRSVEPFHCNP